MNIEQVGGTMEQFLAEYPEIEEAIALAGDGPAREALLEEVAAMYGQWSTSRLVYVVDKKWWEKYGWQKS